MPEGVEGSVAPEGGGLGAGGRGVLGTGELVGNLRGLWAEEERGTPHRTFIPDSRLSCESTEQKHGGKKSANMVRGMARWRLGVRGAET